MINRISLQSPAGEHDISDLAERTLVGSSG